MPPVLDLIAEREAAATAAVRALREQIAKLTEEVALADKELAELAITRKTLMTLTGTAEATTPVDATIAGAAYQKIETWRVAEAATASRPPHKLRAKP